MTIEEFLMMNEENERRAILEMYTNRENYSNIKYEGILPNESYVRTNCILKIVDELKEELLNKGKFLDTNGGLYFLDGLARKIIDSANKK